MPFTKGQKSLMGMLGKHHTEETKKKMSRANKGKKRPPFSDEWKRNISKGQKGRKHSDETKRKMSKVVSQRYAAGHKFGFQKGRTPWNKGLTKKTDKRIKGCHIRPHTERTKMIIKEKRAKQIITEETKKKISKSNKGKHSIPKTDETKRKISEARKGKYNGKNHHDWQGGISFEPYGLEFNNDLREVVRNRDRRKCFICEKTELENREKLTVHHIDYNKQNNNPNNLITLCRGCHIKTNSNRDNWINYFKQKINI